MIISWPGEIPAGHTDPSMTNLIDIVPTLLQLQGLPVPASMQGQPLPTATDAHPRDAAFSEYGAGGPAFTMDDLLALPEPYGWDTLIASLLWREAEGRRKMVRTRDWKYVHDPMGDMDELYDMTQDPWELHNVVHDPAHAEVVAALRLRLADWLAMTEGSRAVAMPEADFYDRARLRGWLQEGEQGIRQVLGRAALR